MPMKRVLIICLAVLLGLVELGACSRQEAAVDSVGTEASESASAEPPEVLHKIRIAAGEDVVYGVSPHAAGAFLSNCPSRKRSWPRRILRKRSSWTSG